MALPPNNVNSIGLIFVEIFDPKIMTKFSYKIKSLLNVPM